MHRASKPSVDTGFPSEDLSQCSVKKKFSGQLFYISLVVFFNHLKDGPVEKFFHDLHQLVIRKLLDSRKPFGQYFSVATVRSQNKIINRQIIGHTYSGGFLTDRQVGRSRIIIFYTMIFACSFYGIQQCFKFPYDCHVPVNPLQIAIAEVLFLLGNAFLVLIDRYLTKGDLTGFSRFFGIYKL